MTDALSTGLATVLEFVPKLILFLLILVIGWFVAKAIAKAISAILERVGFDRAVERGGVKRALENSKFDASDLVAKIVFYALVLFVLQLAFGVFGANPISDLLTDVIAFLPSLVVAIIIVVVAAAIAAGVKTIIEGSLGGLSYGRVLANVASIFILFLGVVAALNQVGVATTVTTPVLITILATIGGIAVVGVGGGLIRPMQSRWDRWINTAEREAPRMREEARRSPGAGEQLRGAVGEHTSSGSGQHSAQYGDATGSTGSTAGYSDPAYQPGTTGQGGYDPYAPGDQGRTQQF